MSNPFKVGDLVKKVKYPYDGCEGKVTSTSRDCIGYEITKLGHKDDRRVGDHGGDSCSSFVPLKAKRKPRVRKPKVVLQNGDRVTLKRFRGIEGLSFAPEMEKWVGVTVTVKRLGSAGYAGKPTFEVGDRPWYWLTSACEKVEPVKPPEPTHKFKVGDVVIAKEGNPRHGARKRSYGSGVVKEVGAGQDICTIVEFPDKCCQWYDENDLELYVAEPTYTYYGQPPYRVTQDGKVEVCMSSTAKYEPSSLFWSKKTLEDSGYKPTKPL